MLPSASCGLRQKRLNGLRPVRLIALRFEVAKQAALVAGNELFQYPWRIRYGAVKQMGRILCQRPARTEFTYRADKDVGLL